MGLVERIKLLCDEKNTTFAEIERKVGISNGQIRRWNESSPKLENVKKVAKYFNVSLDHLTGYNQEQLNEIAESEKQHTLDDYRDTYDAHGFDLEHENDEGIETIIISHFDHGTVKNVELRDFLKRGADILKELKMKYSIDDADIETIAAHHDGDEWSDEELDEIERFKEFVRSKRNK